SVALRVRLRRARPPLVLGQLPRGAARVADRAAPAPPPDQLLPEHALPRGSRGVRPLAGQAGRRRRAAGADGPGGGRQRLPDGPEPDLELPDARPRDRDRVAGPISSRTGSASRPP